MKLQPALPLSSTWSRTSDFQSEKPGSNPGKGTNFDANMETVMSGCSEENGWCGWCGACRDQHQHERDTSSDGCYDDPKESDDEPKVIYWRI